ncbi:MAG TPA: hypothetical protein ENK57_07920 [Polyangiaceae bacterium]|nr:hypothetical protein [Polyangiaceae bacterium]
MTKRSIFSLSLLLGLLSVSGTAQAQKAKDNKPRGVITLAEVTITGRIQKPIAAVDVARIRPKLTLSELRQPFVNRIEKAIYADPF